MVTTATRARRNSRGDKSTELGVSGKGGCGGVGGGCAVMTVIWSTAGGGAEKGKGCGGGGGAEMRGVGALPMMASVGLSHVLFEAFSFSYLLIFFLFGFSLFF